MEEQMLDCKEWRENHRNAEEDARCGRANGRSINDGHHMERWLQRCISTVHIPILTLIGLVIGISVALGGHGGGGSHEVHEYSGTESETGYDIPGVPFHVVVGKGKNAADDNAENHAYMDEAFSTVVEAFTFMTKNRTQYHRYDEALNKEVLKKVVIEPRVFNRNDKEFTFLVARTKEKGKVKLLISASQLERKGYLNQPDKLIPVLAREFQWVVSKADTAPKPKNIHVERDLKKAPIQSNQNIRHMSGPQRVQVLKELFHPYLRTEDAFQSLKGQPWFEIGSTSPHPPAQEESTTHLYEMRVREALQLIMRDSYFSEHTPKAIRSLLNGKIWNVAFVKIEKRDWATRTRVMPKDKAVTIGSEGKVIQPAIILVNYHRTAVPEDPYYPETQGLLMGALSADQLARVIALEIQHNIVDKSMRGHVAQDEITAPK